MKTLTHPLHVLSASIGLALFLTACGGGGGGGGGEEKKPTAVLTESNADSASAAVMNASTLTSAGSYANGFGSAILGGFSATAAPASPSGVLQKQIRFAQALAHSLAQKKTIAIAGSESLTEFVCPNGGTANLNYDVNQTTGTGRYTLTFAQCKGADGETTNGKASINILGINIAEEMPTKLKITFTDFQLDAPGQETTILNHSVTDTLNLTTNTELLSSDLSVQMGARTITAVNWNATLIWDSLVSPTTLQEAYQGLLCDSVQGCMNIATSTSLQYSDFANQDYPDAGGPILIKGSKGQIRLTPKGLQVQVEIDADADDVYEISSLKDWAAITQ